MADRTIYIDAPPHTWQSRKITVFNGRRFATVTLDRDGYVDTRERPDEAELPADYKAAVERLTSTVIDRLGIAGHPYGFTHGSGPRYVTTFADYRDLNETIEALRAAEMDGDLSRLDVLAARLALPFDDWLRPGEREIVRGVDFDGKPEALLEVLRGKAKHLEIRLNGRATPGGVWVNPEMTEIGRMLRQQFPEQYADRPDRWTNADVPEPTRWRPFLDRRERSSSAGVKPVRWIGGRTGVDLDCPCGLRGAWDDYQEDEHRRHHLAWSIGVKAPKALGWWREDIVLVTTESAIMWRRLAHKVARLPMRENGYDFASWSTGEYAEPAGDNKRAYLLRANDHVIGYLTAHDTAQHRRWDLVSDKSSAEVDETLRPRIDLVWVAAVYRSKGVAGRLVETLASDFGCGVADVSWSTPLSSAGLRLAKRLSPGGVWLS